MSRPINQATASGGGVMEWRWIIDYNCLNNVFHCRIVRQGWSRDYYVSSSFNAGCMHASRVITNYYLIKKTSPITICQIHAGNYYLCTRIRFFSSNSLRCCYSPVEHIPTFSAAWISITNGYNRSCYIYVYIYISTSRCATRSTFFTPCCALRPARSQAPRLRRRAIVLSCRRNK